jgi:SAM-dependent methyltransferase
LSGYVFSQADQGEHERLAAMARLWDPETMRAVRALGIGAGQRCLEAGAGTGSVARALAELVGPDGYVLAADRDLRFLGGLPAPVEVSRMDVMAGDLPRGQFDLVHGRLLVAHLHPHRQALRRLADAVAPGGWLLVEEVDWTWADVVVPDAPVHTAMVRALEGFLGQGGGFDATYGRRLLGDVLGLGFTRESARYHGTQSRSTGEAWLAWQLLVGQVQDGILAAGLLTRREVDEWWSLSRDGGAFLASVPMFAVQAQRPPLSGGTA